jgi:hypothetical protein
VTRHQRTIEISRTPPIVAIDTPGVMLPRVPTAEDCGPGGAGQRPGSSRSSRRPPPPGKADPEAGLKLCVTGAVADKIVGEETMLEYLVWKLNAVSARDRGPDASPAYARVLGLPDGRAARDAEALYDHLLPRLYRSNVRRGVQLMAGAGAAAERAMRRPDRKRVNADRDFEGGLEDARAVVARRVLRLYREGRLGRIVLDDVPE